MAFMGDVMFATFEDSKLQRCQFAEDGTMQVLSSKAYEWPFYDLAAAPAAGILFATTRFNDDGVECVAAIDPQTLEIRFRFGQEVLADTLGLDVVGDEIYVCDNDADHNGRLAIFSLTGEYKREIKGPWANGGEVRGVRHVNDRLYILTSTVYGPDGHRQSDRVHTLALDGTVLQTYNTGLSIVQFCVVRGDELLFLAAPDRDEDDEEGPGPLTLLLLRGA